MHAPDAVKVLQAWEDASGLAMPERALHLVAAGLGSSTLPSELARWSLRRRDAALFDLRVRLFGRFADGLVPCPACDTPLEMRLDLAQLRAQPHEDDEAARRLVVDDVALTWRLPNSEDLVAASAEDDENRARARLLAQCVISAERGGDVIAAEALQADAGEIVARAIAEQLTDVAPVLAIECPACGQAAEAPFAIDAFLWREVDGWARRTLQEVHALASEYGWSETEILGLSAARRRLYLELAGRS